MTDETRFEITQLILGAPPVIPISEIEFQAIRTAKNVIAAQIDIEENYTAILENLIELESTMASIAIDQMVFGFHDFQHFRDCLRLVERRLTNLLASCRAYFDRTDHLLVECYGKDSIERKSFTESRNQQHRQEFAYRVMEGLRNHAQHQGTAAHAVTFGQRWIEDELPLKSAEYSFDVFLRPGELATSGKTNSKLREELKQWQEQKIDLKKLFREYVKGIWRVHSGLIQTTKLSSHDSELTLRNAISTFREKGHGETPPHFVDVICTRNGDIQEKIDVFEPYIDYWNSLRARHRSLENFEKRFFTNAPARNNKKTK